MSRLKFLDSKQVSDDSADQYLIYKSPPNIVSIWFCLQYEPLFVCKVDLCFRRHIGFD